MTTATEVLHKLPDGAELGPLEAKDEVLSELIEAYNDRVEIRRNSCNVTLKKLTPESTGADLKTEITKLPIEDQLELLQAYKEGKKDKTSEEEAAKEERQHKWKIIDKLTDLGITVIFLIVVTYCYHGITTGNWNNEIISKLIDVSVDLIKYFSGTNNS
jgi:hypothetical protein